MRIKILFALFILTLSGSAFSQSEDSLIIRKIYSDALLNSDSYLNLEHLCKSIGGRLCGSPQSEKAIEWIKTMLDRMGLDSVYLQETKVRNWVRGDKEYAYYETKENGKITVNVCALGTSIGTGENGIKGKVIEVGDFDDLKKLGREQIEGKIVFFNRPLDNKFINTGPAYGDAADQRVFGAIEAAKYGAIGVIVRSLTLATDTFPHTGVMRYVDSVKKIPAIAISSLDAGVLALYLDSEHDIDFYFRTTCYENEEKKSYNVISEIKGSEYPDEIILIGGHIDSWDTGEGANDDGAGVVQTIDVLRIFKSLNVKPKHTIRFVAFMDEEIAQRGARTYANAVKEKYEKHIVGIESDAGSMIPYGFSMDAPDSVVAKVQSWKNLLLPYNLFLFIKGGSGVDVSFLKKLGIPVFEMIENSQCYFDYHHSPNDVFEHVNERELQFGSASIAALVYLIDKYGL